MRIKLLLILFTFNVANAYEYPKPIAGYYSQKGQDKFLNEEIFMNKRGGIFVEIGAHDGISFSNTYFFEKELDWSGICIEPNPEIFGQLTKNRKCYCEQVCITNSFSKKRFLKCSGYMLEMYSGLMDEFDPRHIERIDCEIEIYGGKKEIIWIECAPFKAILRKYNISHVDFLSIDIEGGEKSALETIDFDAVKIDIIVVENNFDEDVVKNFLLSKGYRYLTRIGKDDIYKNERFS